MPDNRPITLRLDPHLTKKLDKLSDATQRSRSFLLTEAVKQYLEMNEWQVQEIKDALEEADRGEFASQEEVETAFKKLRRRAG
jgi:predicted transcriptional regulator